MTRWCARQCVLWGVGLVAVGCGSAESASLGEAAGLGTTRLPFINGPDDRREYYELEPALQQLMSQSAVAIMSAQTVDDLVSGRVEAIPILGGGVYVDDGRLLPLCSGERFAQQPVGAECSGVLVDWDLVLTAGHCLPPEEPMRVVFGYFHADSGQVEPSQLEVHPVRRVVASQRRGAGESQLDFALWQLEAPVVPPLRPAAVHVEPAAMEAGDPIFTIGAAGGTPLKLDDGARIQSAERADYFVADTDTSGGWSGGGAFDATLRLLGTLARGARDYAERGDSGCAVEVRNPTPGLASEQFTYANRAVAALCETGFPSRLCDPTCGSPCEPGPSPALFQATSSCALAPPGRHPGSRGSLVGLLACGLVAAGLVRRGSRRCPSSICGLLPQNGGSLQRSVCPRPQDHSVRAVSSG